MVEKAHQQDVRISQFYHFLGQNGYIERVWERDPESLKVFEKAHKRAIKDENIAAKYREFVKNTWGEYVYQRLEGAAKGHKAALQLKSIASIAPFWKTASKYILRASVDRIHKALEKSLNAKPEIGVVPGDLWKARTMIEAAIKESKVPERITAEELRQINTWVDEDRILVTANDSGRVEELGDFEYIDLTIEENPTNLAVEIVSRE